MTERKAFKRRVRAHMAATGQTYTRAAAYVHAGNPARRVDTHPASMVAVELLRASGLELDPVSAFGIGGGIGFMHAVFSYKDVPHPLLTLVCQHHPEPWTPAILRRLGVEHEAVSGKRALGRMLDAGRAVTLPVARQSLPWLTSDPLTAREERVIVALPEEGGVRILDGSGAEGSLSQAAVLEAYALSPRTHPVIAVAAGATLPDDVGPAVAAGLRATLSGMTEPVLGNAFDVNFGLSGLRRWSERVSATGRNGWGAAFAGTDVWRRRLVECIDVEHTAPTAGRPLFARVLRRHGADAAAAHVEASAAHWRVIADEAAGGTLDLTALAGHIDAIVAAEAAAIDDLRAALASPQTVVASSSPVERRQGAASTVLD